MSDSRSPDDDGSTSSFFDVMADEEASDANEVDRVQTLKRTLFDLSYLVMNADGTEHISEKMLIRKLEQRMEQEGSVDVGARAEQLQSLLEEGPQAIRERAIELAEELVEQAGDRADVLGAQYLELLKGLIVADANVAPEEYELFQGLCDHWGIDTELPEP